MAISSYSLILILNVGESVGKPPHVMALDMFPIAFGKFFIPLGLQNRMAIRYKKVTTRYLDEKENLRLALDLFLVE